MSCDRPDVSLFGQRRLTRVHSDPHVDRSVAERLARRSRCGQRVGCLRERYEEGVSLRADLDAPWRVNSSRRNSLAPPEPFCSASARVVRASL